MKASLIILCFFISGGIHCQVVYSNFSNTSGKYNPTFSGVCGCNALSLSCSCAFSNTSYVADNDLSNYTRISVTAGILSTPGIRVKLNETSASPANTMAGFYVRVASVVSALPSVTVKTYKNGNVRETIVNAGNLIMLLGGGMGNIFGNTTLDYDEVGISFNTGLATVATTIDIFYAFGGYTSNPNVTLPVRLIDVSASQKDAQSVIIWEVEDDGNTKYELQRSTDGIIFTTIQTETSAIAGKKTFQYIDKTTAGKIVYYRIRITDKNSSHILYSKTINLKLIFPIENNFQVFPNPVTGNQFTIRFDREEAIQYELQVIDETGKSVNKQVLQPTGNACSINTHLKPGVYILKLTGTAHSSAPVYSRLLVQ